MIVVMIPMMIFKMMQVMWIIMLIRKIMIIMMIKMITLKILTNISLLSAPMALGERVEPNDTRIAPW